MSKFYIFLFSILFFILSSSVFIVHEGTRGLVLKFGKSIYNHTREISVYKPGLYFKWPLLEKVHILDSRIKTINSHVEQYYSKEKQNLVIYFYVKWRISDFSRYYFSTSKNKNIQSSILLTKKFNDQLSATINNINFKNIISKVDKKLTTNVIHLLNTSILSLKNKSLNNTNSINKMGITVLDVGITKIDLPESISHNVYKNMKKEQNLIVKRQFFKAQNTSEKLRSITDYKVSVILGEANKKATIIKSTAEVKIIKLFSSIFSKEPNFYFFIRSLRLFENNFNNKNVIFIHSNNNIFQYLKNFYHYK